MHSIDANVLAEWIQQGKNFLLIDVREVFEHEILNIGGYNIPLSEIGRACETLPNDRDIVVYCAKGIRSVIAIQKMEARGLTRLYNLSGGISAISQPEKLTQG